MAGQANSEGTAGDPGPRGRLAQTWLSDHSRRVSERVADGYRDTFRVHLSPRFGDMPLEELRRRDVKDLVGDLVDSGKHRNTIRNILTPLRTMLREAVRDEVIVTNPAIDVEVPASAPTRTTDAPTRQQLDPIIAKARTEDDRDAIRLMAALGLRIGECFALRWSDVDFAGNVVHVRATNHRGRVADRIKTKAGTRLVPLFPSARATLEARRRRLAVTPHPSAFVFANAIGGAMDLGNWRRREWLPALKAAGYEKRFVPHEPRHFASTALYEQGLAGKLRTEVIGHANEDVTNSIYTHVRRERVAAAAADFDPLR